MSAGAPASLPHLGLLFGAYTVTAAQGTYAITGQAATFPVGYGPSYLPHMALLRGASGNSRTLTADQGSYTVSGQAASFAFGGYNLAASVGVFSIIGSDALADHEVTADQGSYAVTGQAAGLNRGYIFTASSGTYAVSGQDATLTATGALALVADTGIYSLTGMDAALFYAPIQVDSAQLVRVRQLSWEEICRRSWGKEWTKREIAYEFSGGRKFEDALEGGPYGEID